MKKLVIIDSQALIHRAFHALPILTDRHGTPTNAVFGFFSVFLKMIKDVKPDAIVACFDLPAPTFRHQAFEDYKAHRPKTPPELIKQIPIVKEILEVFKVPMVELAGYEADDLIGTIATHIYKDHPDWQVIIATGDLDTLQLVNERIHVYTLRKGVADTTEYDPAAVEKRYGLKPPVMRQYKGLVGDASDNIPGVAGIGEKTAIALLQKYPSLESIYEALESSPDEIPNRARAALAKGKDSAFFSRDLATIDCAAPLHFEFEKAHWGGYDKAMAVQILHKYGLRSLVARLPFPTEATLWSAPTNSMKATSLKIIEVKKWATAGVNGADAIGFSGEILAIIKGPVVYWGPVDFKVATQEPVVIHDFKPLARALIQAGLKAPVAEDDTLLAAWLDRPGRSKYDFEALVEIYNLTPISVPENLEPDAVLAIKGAWLAQTLTPILKTRLQKSGLDKILRDLELPLTPILAEMEAAGIKINAECLAKFKKELKAELQTLTKEIYKIADGEFNIQSPKQLREILFEKIKLPTEGIRTTPTGVISTDEQELRKLASHEIVGNILAYRERAKLLNTYVEPLPGFADKKHRVHTSFVQTGTVTGRLSSAEPNLQNIPLRTELGKRVREAFLASEGQVLLSADFSQIELRVVAHIAKDERMLAAFKNGEDIHTTTAAAVLGISPENVTPEIRRRAKAVNFGIIYGLSAFGLAESTGMSRPDARAFIDKYLERFFGVRDYMLKTKQLARQQGYVETLLGRRRYLPDLQSGSFRGRAGAEREAINHPIQGTAADIMKLAMIKVKALPESKMAGAKILLQVHDELLFEVPQGQVNKIAPEIKAAMEGAFKLDVPLEVDLSVGPNWGELKNYSN